VTASGLGGGLRGGLMVCGTTSDAGKSLVVAGLCRWLARQGVRVAPFKAQNMANNAAVTADHREIGHAQWLQAVAARAEPTSAMNPVLLKPTGERTSQVVVRGRPWGELSAREYHDLKDELRPVVLDALAELRDRYDVVVCEGAGSPAEINLLDRDLVNLGLADDAGLPAIVVGDIDRGGVFAALYGTVALLPDRLRARVRGFVVNRLRGDPALLGDACAELERRCGVPTLGVLPHLPGMDLDAEDSLALDHPVSPVGPALDATPGPAAAAGSDVLDVVAVRWPFVANAGDLDPLRLEPHVRVRWVRGLAELGQPDLVVLPGSKATRSDLDWFRRSGLADAVATGDAPVVAVCAGLQMCGQRIDDPSGAEGPPGSVDGLGWLPVATGFEPDKVLDRPTGRVVDGPGDGEQVAGYRIHHGRVTSAGEAAAEWLRADDGTALGWHDGRVLGTSLHALFESDGLRRVVLGWAAERRGKRWAAGDVDFHAARMARLDRIADAVDTHLDTWALAALIAEAAPARTVVAAEEVGAS
jgi:adenosylcobyric acid synthase